MGIRVFGRATDEFMNVGQLIEPSSEEMSSVLNPRTSRKSSMVAVSLRNFLSRKQSVSTCCACMTSSASFPLTLVSNIDLSAVMNETTELEDTKSREGKSVGRNDSWILFGW
mmetsp:Transcript_21445/g.43752  ORF Transcript_21445/g.43752 Transcript_21445/m.43752 type:complete len:112 (-) Transcript_21445:33-368(-)